MKMLKEKSKEKIFKYIDENLDEHIKRCQEAVRQHSISQTGEGVMDMAKLMAKYFKKLGCDEIEIAGPWGDLIDQGGTEGNPVVYAEYDAGKRKTLLVYFMHDTMPISEPEKWSVPPFEARIVDIVKPFPKVLMARGAHNSKSRQMAFLAACYSIKAMYGELPVNVLFISEGDEERQSLGLRKFVYDNVDRLSKADAVYTLGGGQNKEGVADPNNGSEGLLYLDLVTSGEYWGRGPTKYDVHGDNKLTLDSPAWRHIQMLSTITSKDGNKIMVEGWYDDLVTEPNEEDMKLIDQMIKKGAYDSNIDILKEALGAKVFINNIENPKELLKMRFFGTSFNLDGIYGGRMTPGAGALMPVKLTSKHNIRFNANQNADDLVKKLRRHLDKHGYTDVKINVVGVMDWCLNNWNTEIQRAVLKMYDEFKVDYGLKPPTAVAGDMSPAWPAYLFGKSPLKIPIGGGSLGHGGRSHSIDEYYVIEGAGKVYGYADVIKGYISVLFNYAGKT